MAEFYYDSKSGFVAVFPDGKLNNGTFFSRNCKLYGASAFHLGKSYKKVSLSDYPEHLIEKVLECYPGLSENLTEDDEFSGYDVS
jgi:hypothetical protein